ncbi:MAG: endo-1,4-beta-xylanase, partial [Bacteroidales bacterium]|nr:endo-1,4-beta-xylanase [Bacteroidales bacterium]
MFAAGLFLSGCNNSPDKDTSTFKDAFNGKFLVGAALNVEQIAGNEPKALEIAKKHFNSAVAENCMKMENIHPEEDIFFWD